MILLLKKVLIVSVYVLLFLSVERIQGQDLTVTWSPVRAPIMTKWAADVKPDNCLQEYPRPQLVREQWMNLNGLWDYAIRPRQGDVPDSYDGKLLVPYPVESALSGVRKSVGEESCLWYRKSFEVSPEWKEKNVLLHFEAVDWETKVWVNGKLAGAHRGGYDRFSFDITKFLKKEGVQELVVSVWDPTDAGTQPRGKQVKKPHGIWYTSVTGIWQTVWIEPVSIRSIEAVFITPDIDKSLVTLRTSIRNGDKSCSVEATVLEGKKIIAGGHGKAEKTIRLIVPNAKLWSPDSPFLYDLKIYLRDKKGRKVDSVMSYFGMRKTSLGKDESGFTRLMLNNKFIFQLGPLDQGWWPDGLYTAPTDEALRSDIDITKNMGFNLIRKHVKVEPERWYYWCDKIGILVWQDMPSGDASVSSRDGADILRTEESSKQLKSEMKELINGRFNHPSIVMWVPYNEGWGQYNTEEIVKMFLKYDPSRLVDNASGWIDRKTGSVNDMHRYPGPDMPAPENDRAIVLGEFGGLGLPIENHTWQTKDNWGYRNFKSRDTLRIQYENLIKKLKPMAERGLSAAVYTQTTDVEIEVNGLMTYDRNVMKIDPAILFSINSVMWRK